MNKLPELASKIECTGCTTCANICAQQCIDMSEDIEGFLYPKINLSQCISCGICEQVCPVLNGKRKNEILTKAYSAFTYNNSLRKESSSGGIFSELAILILRKEGIVYGASYDDNCTVEHIGVDNIKDLKKLRGAKYSQSQIGSIFQSVKEQLESNRQVLFSGTPCQVAGLKSFLHRDYDNLFCIDFVCHGVPSPLVWKEYIKYREDVDNEDEVPQRINLRNKESGWSKYSYSVEIVYQDKKRYFCKYNEDPFMRFFVGDYILRKSCGECHFKGYSRDSDITLGDFWGIWDIDPDMDDNKGTSLVLTHSTKGEEMFKAISSNIKSKSVSLEQASAMNPSLTQSVAHKPTREHVLYEISQNGFCAALPYLKSSQYNKDIIKENVLSIIKKLLKHKRIEE